MSTENTKKKFSRRKFFLRAAAGTGVVLGIGYFTRSYWRRSIYKMVETAPAPYLGSMKSPQLWFEITAENKVRLHSPKVEMGQGSHTGMAQLAAEELEITMEQIEVVHAESASENVDPFATGGSTTIEGFWVPLRELAATMREMLRNAAAQQWNVDPATLSIQEGMIQGNNRSISFGELVQSNSEWKIPDTPELKSNHEFKYIGKDIPRLDLTDKVKGAPIFGMDASLPGMLYGAVCRSPLIGATLKDADISAAESMPGVVSIVEEKDFIGVVANSYQEAENAKNAIVANWESDRNWQTQDIQDLTQVGNGKKYVIQKSGNAERVFKNEDVVTAEYFSPIGAHAQIEPNGSLADVRADQATIYMSTQVIRITRDEVAKALGFSKDQVNIVPTYLGGGFGRRLHTPNAIQAALLSKSVGKPVKCFLNRKEEFQHDTFRPPTHHVMRGVLDNNGNLKALEHQFSSGAVAWGSPMLPSAANHLLGADVGAIRGGSIQYRAIPNHQSISWRIELPFATSWWRSLGLLANTFAIESFMDELAVIAGKDPIQFRLATIPDDEPGVRLKGVIQAAADRAGWKHGMLPNGRAMGFACSTDAKTPVAQIAEVSYENNEIKVHKVTCAMDCGVAVNPDQVRAQCEGSIIMGLSAALYEKMEVVDGALQPVIYGPYRMAQMRHAPKEIDVVLVQGVDYAGAVGEPPLGPIGAAIANALQRITGERFRSMPLAG